MYLILRLLQVLSRGSSVGFGLGIITPEPEKRVSQKWYTLFSLTSIQYQLFLLEVVVVVIVWFTTTCAISPYHH